MKIEKFVNSKFYKGFEWFYRLVFLNLLVLTISLALALTPFLIFIYKNDSGFYILLGIILFIIGFVPASISSFITIKELDKDPSKNVFKLYFVYFIDTIKRLYLVELIFIPVFSITLYGIYYYWTLLGPEYFTADILSFTFVIAFVIEFFFLMILMMVYVNFNFLFAYFVMKPFTYLRLAFKFAFKYLFESFISFVILLVPVLLLFLLTNAFLPIYFILGISLPQYFIFRIVRNKYEYFSRNIDNLSTDYLYLDNK